MRGIFVGLTKAELVAIRGTAVVAAATGRVTTSFTAPGLSGTQQVFLDPAEALLEANYALQRLDPSTYGRHLITKRTRIVFA
jgi:hypothetical protein